jgi:phosphomannomutase
MDFPAHIFKAYDIRGLIDGELSNELAYGVGRAFACELREEKGIMSGQIVVGHDMRDTSPAFQAAVIKGMTDEGYDVVDIGLVSTPLFNYACAHVEAHVGGIMVTASHNPAPYNGFKITEGNGLPVGQGNGMERIRDCVQAEVWTDAPKKGSVSKMNMLADYVETVFSLVPKSDIKPMKIVIDYANGMGGVVLPTVIKDLPIEVISLYEKPDGNFPNHEANPLKVETLADLQAKVIETGADFGFALDGDADRIGLVDEQGAVVDASFVGALLGLEVLQRHDNTGVMLYDLRSSMIVRDVWEAAGATVEMSKVGHANIKKEMKEKNAIYASELSLHLYYGDVYDLESTDLSLLLLLSILTKEQKPLSEIMAPFKKYFHSGEINFVVENKDGVIAKLEQQYGSSATTVSHLDGLWMEFDWGWFNIRKSNTEPVLRLNLETHDEAMLVEKVAEVERCIGGPRH